MTATSEQAAQLYAKGLDIRTIGHQLGCSHEWVRQLLVREGIPLRRPGKRLASKLPLSEMAQELFADLDDHFGEGGATIADLVGWFGERASTIRFALGELISCGWATLADGRYFAAAESDVATEASSASVLPGESGLRHIYDRGEVERLLRGTRLTFLEIANRLGVTKGVVAGIAYRSKARA